MAKYSITAGQGYADIDAFACAIALQELLEKEGHQAEVVFTSHLNQSVTPSIKSWKCSYSKTRTIFDSEVIIVDLSEPTRFEPWVKLDEITYIYDHHFGFEQFWQEKLKDRAGIEHVGACATLIWERFKATHLTDQISSVSANLLYTAILSNTLNLKASVTTEKDLRALEEIKTHTDLPNNWKAQYFQEVEATIFEDIPKAIRSDTKVQELPKLSKSFVIGQIELWESRLFIQNYQVEIENILASYGYEFWMMTAPSISEGVNYIYAKNPEVQRIIGLITNSQFKNGIAKTGRLWLRKEIIRELQTLED